MRTPLFGLAIPILALPRASERFVAASADLGLCVLAVWISYCLRFGGFVPLSGKALWVVAATVGLALPIFVVSGLYRASFRHGGWPALLPVARAVGIYGLLYASVFTAIGIAGVPRTVGILQPILLLLFVGASRALAPVWLGGQDASPLRHTARPKVLIYGAGTTGRRLAAAMRNHEMRVVGFLDDDDRLHGRVLQGHPVYNPADLADLVPSLAIDNVLLAMPRVNRKRRNEILGRIRTAGVAARALPSLSGPDEGMIGICGLRELEIDDLLDREPVMPNHILLSRNIRNKVVMVTGAGGSIGSELCRQILAVGPSKLLLINQSELALCAIHLELEEKAPGRDVAIVPLLASVQDAERMREIMSTWVPDTVYHAAAYKDVPLVEHNPAECIKNNVLGTLRTAQAAMEHGVCDFVLISTDQAARPRDVMGASKRLAELVLQALAASQRATRFSIVRFGNVLDSPGSLVPRVRQQIRDGGPITLSHPDVTRCLMSVAEASQLVIQAGAMSRGGDVFVLDMGQPVKALDLARRMVELCGLTVKDSRNPEGDIEIRFTGLGPAEQLDEDLPTGSESAATPHPRIMKAHADFIRWADLEGGLNALEMALNLNDVGVIRLMMEKLVSGYAPGDRIVDWVYLEQRADAQSPGPEDGSLS